MITRFITTRIESIARSAARRPRYAPAHPQQFRPRLTTTRGGHIAAVCFRHRSPPDLYFATHRVSQIRMPNWSRGRIALVGDAAFCVSLLAGQGSALAMISAYVLAGELGAAEGRYQHAFARYEALLRSYIGAKQRGAE
jgi:2-polyprenyl-6-methoxyphenol hydroxylase-like FAD-dependent oxidoreductase